MELGKLFLGIEFGSTRIKGVLIDEKGEVVSVGGTGWENKLENGVWTYGLDEIKYGLQNTYSEIKKDMKSRYGITITTLGGIGISGMMHGYMPFDKDDNLLSPFRTWRNTITEQASKILTEKFGFHIPQRWSIAHLYQSILNGESHLKDLSYITTLAVYVHKLLTNEFVVGIGEGSGMFPIDSAKNDYNEKMIQEFEKMTSLNLKTLLPKVLVAGENAGCLTETGALLLDVDGDLQPGIPFCPPEGDAGTGMVATNSVKKRTGNVSAGTSIFAMAVLERPLSKLHEEIDVVTTPCGKDVAMVHCNNCTSDINAWADVFKQVSGKDDIYTYMFKMAEQGDNDCGGIVSCNYLSGEHLTGCDYGMPMVLRGADSKFTPSNFFRNLIYSSMATLKLGMEILTDDEHISLDKITGHGGLFKTEGVGASIMASALNVPVTVQTNAGEGGAWGIAVLALYMANKSNKELYEFLEELFINSESKTYQPNEEIANGFKQYIYNYKKILKVEQKALEVYKD